MIDAIFKVKKDSLLNENYDVYNDYYTFYGSNGIFSVKQSLNHDFYITSYVTKKITSFSILEINVEPLVYKAFEDFYNSFKEGYNLTNEEVTIKSQETKNELTIKKNYGGYIWKFKDKSSHHSSNISIAFNTHMSFNIETTIKVANFMKDIAMTFEEYYQYSLEDVKYLTKKKNKT